MKSTFRMLSLVAALLLPLLTQAQSLDYLCTFENDSDTADWTFVNSPTNAWVIDSAVAQAGSKSLYISSDGGATNSYNNGTTAVSFAYQQFAFEPGGYNLTYNWRCNGESAYDFIRVFLAPKTATFQANVIPGGFGSSYNFQTAVPAGWISLNGSRQHNQQSTWQTNQAEFTVTDSDTLFLVFVWVNDGSGGSAPAGGIDNVHLEEDLCPGPIDLAITNLTPTQFDFSWRDLAATTTWFLELDTLSQTQGSNPIITVYDTFYTFSGLTSGTTYTIHVAASCNGDTSVWRTAQIKTPCDPITQLPLFEDFEVNTGDTSGMPRYEDCWYKSHSTFTYPSITNSTANSHNGGSRSLYWVNASGAYGVYMPQVDTTVYPLNTLQLSFWCKATSTTYVPTFQVGVVTNILDPDSFIPVATVPVTSGTNWSLVTVPLTSYTGPDGFIAIMAVSTASGWYAYTDDFTLEPVPDCPHIASLAASRVGSGSAYLSWGRQGGSTNPVTRYVVQYDTVGAPAYSHSDTVVSSPYMVSGLEHSTQYVVRVRALCDTLYVGDWDSITIRTASVPCIQASSTSSNVTLSTATTTYSGVFVNTSWGNTFCEAIYTAAELQAAGLTAGRIIGITLGYNAAGSYSKELTIFMGNTNMDHFTSTSEMIPVANLTQVTAPIVRTNTSDNVGWVQYQFTTPFYWDGSSNIVLATFMNQYPSSQSSSGFYGYSFSSGRAGSSIYRYKDSSPFTADNCMSTGNSSGATSYLPSISFLHNDCMQYGTCAAPLLMLTHLDIDTVSIEWGAGHFETSWNISYQAEGDTTWTVIPNVTSMTYDFTTLLPMTNYVVRVAPTCGGDSIYSQVEFMTPCVPIATLPFTEDFENFTAASTAGSPITTCWNRISSYTYTSYPYVSTSYAHSGTHSMYFYNPSSYYTALVTPSFDMPADTLQVSFAAYKTSAAYQITVGVMSDPNDFSTYTPIDTISPANVNEWEMFEVPLTDYAGNGRYIAIAAVPGTATYMYVDDLEVTYVPHCPRPRNITIDSVSTTAAIIHWSSPANDFIVEYGPYGFEHGNGITVTTTDDSIILYNLQHSTSYQVYVRAICGVNDTSEWSFATNFFTSCGHIDALPFYEDFTSWGVGTSARPACWTMGGYSLYPYIANLSTGDTTYRCLYMYSYGSNRVYASLPELDSLQFPINNHQVVFTAMSNTASSTLYSHDLIVGVCSIPGDLTTFRAVDTVTLTDRVASYEVDFDTITSGGRYITFVSTAATSAYYNYAYLLNVSIEPIPTCRRPNHVVASNITSTSADISWNDRNNSLTWQVEYGPTGFTHGQGVSAIVTTNPYTITGLSSSTDYDVYVRSICNAGDTSDWVLAPYHFATLQNPAPVPYYYDFETPGEWANWQTCSNIESVNWYRDTAGGNSQGTPGLYTMYISADSGRTVSTNFNAFVNVAAYRDFDFGSDPYHTYKLSFRAKVGGSREGTSIYDGLLLYHVNPNTPVVASNNALESPWGHVNTVPRLHLINSSGYWNTYEVILDSLTGIHRFAFFWFNQYSNTGIPFIGLPPIVDEITITSYECPRPAGLSAFNVTSATADVDWVAPDTGTYRVVCRAQTGSSHRIDTTVHTNHVHLVGLNPGIRYSVQVRRICSADDSSSLSTQMTFYTLICNDGRNDTLADPVNFTTSFQFPLATHARYSYTQQIFTSEELGSAGEISALNFNYAGTTAITNRNNCTIYLGHTSLSSFSGQTPVDPESLTAVYVGQIHTSEGWNRIILSTPFVYNGRSNVVMAICDNSNVDTSRVLTFYADQTTVPMALEIPSASRITPTLAGLSQYASDMHFVNMRSQCIVEVCPNNPCPPPTLRNALVRTGRVTLRWRNTSDRYIISYRTSEVSSWTVDNLMVSDTFFNINSVYPNTEYTYRVRQYCDSTGVSNWIYGTFNTGMIPCLPPEDLHVTSLSNNKVNLAWTPAENNLDYEVHVFNSAFDKVVTSYVARTLVRGLQAGLTYYAAVRANCAGFDDPGEYSDTISFTTPVCPDVSNLRVVEVYGNSAVVDWTPGGEESSWEIVYGAPGFDIESGVSVVANEHPFTLTQLIGSTPYEVYVRALCASDFASEHWAGPAVFTTLYSDINSVSDDARVHLHPNPTNGDVTLTLPDCAGNARVEILDVTGRVCSTIQLHGNGGQHKLSTSALMAGTYFLRITADEVNAVKKLIVR